MSLGAVVSLAGCSNRKDVVATSTSNPDSLPDGTFATPQMTPAPCQEGNYSGSFFTTKRDGGPSFQYSGSITFTLTKSLSGEFKVLDDTAKLQGMGTDGSKFVADIVSGTCREGTFQTELENGMFTPTTGSMFTFDGHIEGAYATPKLSDAAIGAFAGFWTTNLHLLNGDVVVGGNWSAAQGG